MEIKKETQLKKMIKHMVRDEVWAGEHCEFYQLSSGLRVTYDRATHEYTKFDFNGEPLDDEGVYKIGLQQFHFNNLEDFFNISFDEMLRGQVGSGAAGKNIAHKRILQIGLFSQNLIISLL